MPGIALILALVARNIILSKPFLKTFIPLMEFNALKNVELALICR